MLLLLNTCSYIFFGLQQGPPGQAGIPGPRGADVRITLLLCFVLIERVICDWLCIEQIFNGHHINLQGSQGEPGETGLIGEAGVAVSSDVHFKIDVY